MNLLVDEGIVYKKRGLGMFVSTGSRLRILTRRKQAFFQDFILPLLEEARNLGLSPEDVVEMLNHSTGITTTERRNLDEQH